MRKIKKLFLITMALSPLAMVSIAASCQKNNKNTKTKVDDSSALNETPEENNTPTDPSLLSNSEGTQDSSSSTASSSKNEESTSSNQSSVTKPNSDASTRSSNTNANENTNQPKNVTAAPEADDDTQAKETALFTKANVPANFALAVNKNLQIRNDIKDISTIALNFQLSDNSNGLLAILKKLSTSNSQTFETFKTQLQSLLEQVSNLNLETNDLNNLYGLAKTQKAKESLNSKANELIKAVITYAKTLNLNGVLASNKTEANIDYLDYVKLTKESGELISAFNTFTSEKPNANVNINDFINYLVSKKATLQDIFLNSKTGDAAKLTKYFLEIFSLLVYKTNVVLNTKLGILNYAKSKQTNKATSATQKFNTLKTNLAARYATLKPILAQYNRANNNVIYTRLNNLNNLEFGNTTFVNFKKVMIELTKIKDSNSQAKDLLNYLEIIEDSTVTKGSKKGLSDLIQNLVSSLNPEFNVSSTFDNFVALYSKIKDNTNLAIQIYQTAKKVNEALVKVNELTNKFNWSVNTTLKGQESQFKTRLKTYIDVIRYFKENKTEVNSIYNLQNQVLFLNSYLLNMALENYDMFNAENLRLSQITI
ncbi:hypothetical protein [Mycoplasma struthionis]|uniref:Variable surface lipoprotein n=1 Tax=Mycoplasma struthionis TaxID=538220 RepID=A0A502M8K7_9MOLU|nr:hypothetical protein [Mycoplasma struthionis]TPI01326.1 hypothetical protein FJM01_02735 [Mycoplasma struthionis]